MKGKRERTVTKSDVTKGVKKAAIVIVSLLCIGADVLEIHHMLNTINKQLEQ